MSRADRILIFDKLAIGTAAVALLVAGIFVYRAATPAAAHATGRAHAAAAVTGRTLVEATIVTDAQTGKDGLIAFVPANWSVPANSTVTFRITNFDDATALPSVFSTVRGTVGNVASHYSISAADPNAPGTLTAYSSLNPKTSVSHTLTIASLGVNVPIAPHSVTVFTIHTGKAGVYQWHCMDPCGTGAAGWGAAMDRTGYMAGTLTVTAA